MRKLIVLIALFASHAVPADAAVTYVVAGPASQVTQNYATPFVIAPVGGPLTFLNQDVQAHNVISDANGPGDQEWCVLYGDGECPLFWSEAPQAGGGTKPVLGLENAESGATYVFRCRIHGTITGTLLTV